MKAGGLHDSMTTPETSMFVRARGTTLKKAATVNDTMSQALSQIASALIPKPVAGLEIVQLK